MEKPDYNEWLQDVDGAVETRLGIGTQDLEDMGYRDWSDDGLTQEDAVTEVLEVYDELECN